ncbi:hypothetical protein [Mycobacteroides abscessus]|uniref:hypothetical protein n=1 Tax=Mycobacteroides abscessus TaxID=36809 RepID=UPI000926DC7A|nr:hypothetical protein [Mycobacteroides abscessus]MDO3333916.1 hypothetical protein [Mycobacteroides abscessus subsp. bolletii]QSM86872.1 hypothetical protein I3U44_13225 [Mycobacteroides abscessus subsp. bolletii]SIB89814.1 Uncharacterised protein [Mycobacteroides abscessus subsp. bolletii]SKS87802.1 Uncharacterised protein [Mycobacteroides abscessus subsp. bolletii]SKT11059.1 Uncharacterised protein [Mycobacteroides abscessus subsp. bolletii]
MGPWNPLRRWRLHPTNGELGQVLGGHTEHVGDDEERYRGADCVQASTVTVGSIRSSTRSTICFTTGVSSATRRAVNARFTMRRIAT